MSRLAGSVAETLSANLTFEIFAAMIASNVTAELRGHYQFTTRFTVNPTVQVFVVGVVQ